MEHKNQKPRSRRKSSRSLQENLDFIHQLLSKQRLVENLIQQQHQNRQDVLESLLHRQHTVELQQRLANLHTADAADLLEALPLEERQLIWTHLDAANAAEILLELSTPVRRNIIHHLGSEALLNILSYMDADDLAYIAEDLPVDTLVERQRSLSAEEQNWLHSSRYYPSDSVGYLMSNEMVTVREGQTLAEIQQHLRQLDELPIHNDKLFVKNPRGALSGAISLQSILLNAPAAKVEDVMAKEVVKFHPNDNAKEAAHAFERYDLVSAPVINDRGKIVGRLTVDVVVDFIREDTSEDVINMAGLSEEEDLYAPVVDSAKNRGTWLLINLFSTFIAAMVIGMFEDTIKQLVALAALMPIVASVGGNSGNQTTALIIRGMALGQIDYGNTLKLLRKEVTISLLNGLILGLAVGIFAFLLYHDAALSLVIAIAMSVTLIIAAVLGFSVPLLLQKAGRDPALGSSVLQTATTDSLAFFVFLGMATLFLR